MKKLYIIFKSQKFGIITGFTITGLLIIGSLIMNFFPHQYAGLSGEDISFFFLHKKPIHTWFYLLFLACIFYGINTFLCTLDSIIKKVKVGIKKIPLYGASVVHIGFIITLVTHLIGGFYSSSEMPVSVSSEWTNLGDVEMKVTDIKESYYPNGMPKKIKALVTLKKDGVEYSDSLGYNNPVLLQHGVFEILLRDYGWIASSVVLLVDDRACNLKIDEPFHVNGDQMRVADLYMPPQYRYPVVKLISAGGSNSGVQQTFLPIGEKNTKEINGSKITFADIKTAPGVLVNVKKNPSIPLTFVTIVFFSVGMLLVILRTVGRMVNS